MTPVPLIILGVGGTSLELVDIALDINQAAGEDRYRLCGFLDDCESRWHTEIRGLPVLGSVASARDYGDATFVNGIGSPGNFFRKREILERSGIPEERFATLIHPTASVSRTARIGPGCVLHQYVVLQNNVQLGRHVLICPFTLIGHDASLGDYTTVSIQVGVIGGVRIGASCYLGANCSVLRDLGEGCLVGMSSCVIREVEAHRKVAGNPARVLGPVR